MPSTPTTPGETDVPRLWPTLLMLCLPLARCARTDTRPAGSMLRFSMPGDFRSFDPPVIYDGSNVALGRLIFPRLLDYDDAGQKLLPDLAETMPAVSADGKTITFRLRKGIFYS